MTDNVLKIDPVLKTYSQGVYRNLQALDRMGWAIDKHAHEIEEFTATANFDEKTLRLHIPKADLAHDVTNRLLADIEDKQFGRIQYWVDDEGRVQTTSPAPLV